MPENRKEPKNCHECGLEAIDDCETRNVHIPADENSGPCLYCVRNPERHKLKTLWRADFFDEQWTRDAQKNPIIEDTTTPHERFLLRCLHGLMRGEEPAWPHEQVKNDAARDKC